MSKQTEIDKLKRRIETLVYENKFLKRENDRLVKKNERMRKKEEQRMKKAEEEEKKELAYFIKQQRTSLDLTRAELARSIGVSSSRLLNYEKGEGRLEGMKEVSEKINDFRKGKNKR
ncbi:HTH DNA binding domain protein [Bacillus phage 000TH010]|uniref:HTH DNA binding domain protein n=1 Tax=Bacillus phage 000TH010 TaxID=2601652 RepID=A0A5P8PHY0_9CAUD|nr:HTH DNA binding domain protein [Bacillus phage 000TH010]QFR56284.1 HTH DNA binding domain protein [Bacillus phage 000TH010]